VEDIVPVVLGEAGHVRELVADAGGEDETPRRDLVGVRGADEERSVQRALEVGHGAATELDVRVLREIVAGAPQ
jgi:hypothetical protein